MPEENQEIDHRKNIGILAQDYATDEYLKNYKENSGKKDGDTLLPIRGLTSILTQEDPSLENILLNAQLQAIENEVANYHNQHKEDIEKAVKETGSQLAEQYAAGLDGLIGKLVEEASKDKRLEGLDAKQKDASIRPLIYLTLVQNLEGLKPTDEEIEKAFKELYGLDKADEREIYDAVNGYLTEDRELSSNAINIVDRGSVYRDSVVPRKKAMLSRFIASKLIKEEEGKYGVDIEKFKKIYGTADNYRKIAYDFAMAAERAQRQVRKAA